MLRTLLGAVSPAGAQARLSILIFHRVLAGPDPLFPGEVDTACFDAICAWVRHWHHVLPLDEAAERLRDGSLPSRALSITFDDGYADNHDVALPILQRHGLPATFFVATGFLDGGCMWNDRVIEAVRLCRGDVLDLSAIDGLAGPVRARYPLGSAAQRRQAIDTLLGGLKYLEPVARLACTDAIVQAAAARLPGDLMMRSDQVAALARAGMQIGGHTVNHPILARLSDTDALDEISRGRAALESITQAPVLLFAYPNGRPGTDYGARDVALVRRAGFCAAVSTSWGAATGDSDIYQLPRFTPWDRTRLRFGLRLAMNARRTGQVCVSADAAAGAPASHAAA